MLMVANKTAGICKRHNNIFAEHVQTKDLNLWFKPNINTIVKTVILYQKHKHKNNIKGCARSSTTLIIMKQIKRTKKLITKQ